MATTEPASFQNPGVLLEASTSAALGADGVFTGEWVNVSYFPAITTAVKTDQSGTLQVQFSPDKTNIDATTDYSISSGNTENILPVQRKWMRVVYTNGGTPQTYMRLQAMAGYQDTSTGGGGTSLEVPFYQQVSAGTATGYSIVRIAGEGFQWENKPIGPSLVSTWNGFIDNQAVAVNVDSNNGNDTMGGLGVNSVRVTGLDSVTKEIVSEVIELDFSAAGGVTGSQLFYRILSMETETSGLGLGAGAPITLRWDNTKTLIVLAMANGENNANGSFYTIPANKRGYLLNLDAGTSRTTDYSVTGYIQTRTNQASTGYRRYNQFKITDDKPYYRTFNPPLELPPLTDFAIQFKSASVSSQSICVNADILLEDL